MQGARALELPTLSPSVAIGPRPFGGPMQLKPPVHVTFARCARALGSNRGHACKGESARAPVPCMHAPDILTYLVIVLPSARCAHAGTSRCPARTPLNPYPVLPLAPNRLAGPCMHAPTCSLRVAIRPLPLGGPMQPLPVAHVTLARCTRVLGTSRCHACKVRVRPN